MSSKKRTPQKAYVVISNRNNQVLLVQEKIGGISGLWGLPGGGIEIDEGIREGLRREVQEEIGCDVKLIAELQMSGENRRIFTGEIGSTDIKINASELLDARWCKLEEAKKLPLRGQWVQEAVEKALA